MEIGVILAFLLRLLAMMGIVVSISGLIVARMGKKKDRYKEFFEGLCLSTIIFSFSFLIEKLFAYM